MALLNKKYWGKIKPGMKLRGVKLHILPGEFTWVATEMVNIAWRHDPPRLERALRAGEIVKTVSKDESVYAATVMVDIYRRSENFCMRDIRQDFDLPVSSTCTRMRDLILYGSGDKPSGRWNARIRGKSTGPVVFQKQCTEEEANTIQLANLLAAHELGEVVNWKEELPKLEAGSSKLLTKAKKLAKEKRP